MSLLLTFLGSKSGICYFTTIQKCCFRTGLELELASDRVTVGARSIEVAKLYAGRSGKYIKLFHTVNTFLYTIPVQRNCVFSTLWTILKTHK